MKTILAALFVTTLAGTAFATEANHNGQLVSSTTPQASSSVSGFSSALSYVSETGHVIVGADRGAFTGK